MSLTIRLPDAGGVCTDYVLSDKPLPVTPPDSPFSGHPIAAAHAVADPTSYLDPSQGGGIDREGTLNFQHHLLGLGMDMAVVMDTAQRSMRPSWDSAL